MQNTLTANVAEEVRIKDAVDALHPDVRRGVITDGEAYMTVSRECDADIAAPVLTVLAQRVFTNLGFTPEVKTERAAIGIAVRRARPAGRRTA